MLFKYSEESSSFLIWADILVIYDNYVGLHSQKKSYMKDEIFVRF